MTGISNNFSQVKKCFKIVGGASKSMLKENRSL